MAFYSGFFNSNGFDRSVAESFEAAGRIVLSPGEELVLEK